MKKAVAVIGSTGLTGKTFLESVSEGEFQSLRAISRRAIPSLDNRPFITQMIHDFHNLENLSSALQVDVLVCALGTTIKIAGSQQRFFEVDHDLPLEIARSALKQGCRSMVLVSSVGANPDSRVFYSRVKGQLERDLSSLGFEQLHILRPSMLLGPRPEKRPGELLGRVLMQPIQFLIPWKYKPIQANAVAAKLVRCAQSERTGVHIYEGQALFVSE